eukprot:5541186-Pleurochrysis_carterae.AAC.1
MRVSIATTSAPRALSSDGSVEAAEPSPEKATRTRGRSPTCLVRAAAGAAGRGCGARSVVATLTQSPPAVRP